MNEKIMQKLALEIGMLRVELTHRDIYIEELTVQNQELRDQVEKLQQPQA